MSWDSNVSPPRLHPNTTDLLTRNYSFVPDARKTDRFQIHNGPSNSSAVCIFGELLRMYAYMYVPRLWARYSRQHRRWQLGRQRHFLLISYRPAR